MTVICHMGPPATRHKWTPTSKLVLDLPTRGMEGWVDLELSTRHCTGRESNSRSPDHKSDALTTTPPSLSRLWLVSLIVIVVFLLNSSSLSCESASNPLSPSYFPKQSLVPQVLLYFAVLHVPHLEFGPAFQRRRDDVQSNIYKYSDLYH